MIDFERGDVTIKNDRARVNECVCVCENVSPHLVKKITLQYWPSPPKCEMGGWSGSIKKFEYVLQQYCARHPNRDDFYVDCMEWS